MTSPEPKVDADPRFELGSVTKGLTGMLLADAVGRGELTLETTAGEILAARPELHERTRGPLHTITLRELCTHTAGAAAAAADGGHRRPDRALLAARAGPLPRAVGRRA